MRMLKYLALLTVFLPTHLYADDFDAAMGDVKRACANISSELSHLKKMAGINTAITGVGTAAATGATVVGIVKSSVDKELREILAKVDEYKAKASKNPSMSDVLKVYDTNSSEYSNLVSEQGELYKKSKSLGNWRTGLLGGATATNIAGAIIAGHNKVDDELQARIDGCINAVDALSRAIAQASLDGKDVSTATRIANECGQWRGVNLAAINKRARGAMVSSIVGATTGAAGTVTSAMANTDSVRNGDEDKERNLNTASNVLAGGTAAASGVATIFNATQIGAIKKAVQIADACERVLW